MTDYAEHHDIVNTSQEGFGRAVGTARQLLVFQNVMSHAKLFREDIYLMYMDFSSAFHTIDHDTLLTTIAQDIHGHVYPGLSSGLLGSC